MRHRNLPLLVLALCCLALVGLTACGGGAEKPAAEAPAATSDAAAKPGGPMGSAAVAGTVTYSGAIPPLNPIQMDADPACAGMHSEPVMPEMLVLGDGQTMGNIFVKVTNAPAGSYAPPAGKVTIDQRGCRYLPHVAGLIAGQELEFLNSDGVLHNVHGLPKENREFNLGMPATLKEKSVTLNQPEPLFPVKCDVHPWMNAFVAVMTHPFFDVTEKDGAYRLDKLPAGTYTVEAWHERLGTQSQEVTVAEGETATVDFTFSAPSG